MHTVERKHHGALGFGPAQVILERDEIQLISDGDGLAVVGNQAAVERFLVSDGLPSSKDLGLPRLGSVLGTAQAAADATCGALEHRHQLAWRGAGAGVIWPGSARMGS